jgi:hypothetical protein
MFYDGFANMKPAPSRSRVRRIFSSHPGPQKVKWYKWEFLRRNPKFCADYNDFMGSFGAWLNCKGPWGDSGIDGANWTKSDKKYFRTTIEPVLAELCRKWQVSDLFPPELDLGEAILALDPRGRGLTLPTWLPAQERRDSRSIRELEDMGFMGRGTKTKVYENLLLMQFDLNSPMKDLLEHAQHILRSAHASYRKELDKQSVRLPRGRRRFSDYDLHLRVWDLKQEGKPNPEIARLVFPNYSSESALNKVRDHLKAANKLISGHSKEIR